MKQQRLSAAVRVLGFQNVRQEDISQAARPLPTLPFAGEKYDQEASYKDPDADPQAHAHGHTLANPIPRGKLFRDTLRAGRNLLILKTDASSDSAKAASTSHSSADTDGYRRTHTGR